MAVPGWVRSLGRRLSRGGASGVKDALGQSGERLAEQFLRHGGYRVLERNMIVPSGEADLVCVAPDERTIVIVEVKTRTAQTGRRGPFPEVSVTAAKRGRMAKVARHLAKANDWQERPMRLDIVAIEMVEGNEPRIRHFIDAVRR